MVGGVVGAACAPRRGCAACCAAVHGAVPPAVPPRALPMDALLGGDDEDSGNNSAAAATADQPDDPVAGGDDDSPPAAESSEAAEEAPAQEAEPKKSYRYRDPDEEAVGGFRVLEKKDPDSYKRKVRPPAREYQRGADSSRHGDSRGGGADRSDHSNRRNIIGSTESSSIPGGRRDANRRQDTDRADKGRQSQYDSSRDERRPDRKDGDYRSRDSDRDGRKSDRNDSDYRRVADRTDSSRGSDRGRGGGGARRSRSRSRSRDRDRDRDRDRVDQRRTGQSQPDNKGRDRNNNRSRSRSRGRDDRRRRSRSASRKRDDFDGKRQKFDSAADDRGRDRRVERSHSARDGCTKLLFYDLPKDMPLEEVYEKIEQQLKGYGLRRLEVFADRDADAAGKGTVHTGNASAEFVDAPCTKRALLYIQKQVFRGKKYQVQLATDANDRGGLQKMSSSGRTVRSGNQLYIGNLRYDVTVDELRDLFKTFGSVSDVRFPKAAKSNSPRCAFVEFNDSEAAEKARESTNNTVQWENKIRVEYANTKPEFAVPQRSVSNSRDSRDSRDAGSAKVSPAGSGDDRGGSSRDSSSRSRARTPGTSADQSDTAGGDGAKSGGGKSGGGTQVLVKDISLDITEDLLTRDMSRCGEVTKVMMLPPNGNFRIAYVRFGTAKEAKTAFEAMNGWRPRMNSERGWIVTLTGSVASRHAETPPIGAPDGAESDAKPAVAGAKSAERTSLVAGTQGSTRITVSGISEKAHSVGKIASLFEAHGEIVNVKLNKPQPGSVGGSSSSRTATVEFADPKSAEQAVRQAHGTVFMGQKMSCSILPAGAPPVVSSQIESSTVVSSPRSADSSNTPSEGQAGGSKSVKPKPEKTTAKKGGAKKSKRDDEGSGGAAKGGEVEVQPKKTRARGGRAAAKEVPAQGKAAAAAGQNGKKLILKKKPAARARAARAVKAESPDELSMSDDASSQSDLELDDDDDDDDEVSGGEEKKPAAKKPASKAVKRSNSQAAAGSGSPEVPVTKRKKRAAVEPAAADEDGVEDGSDGNGDTGEVHKQWYKTYIIKVNAPPPPRTSDQTPDLNVPVFMCFCCRRRVVRSMSWRI